jgi:hypothetical protein
MSFSHLENKNLAVILSSDALADLYNVTTHKTREPTYYSLTASRENLIFNSCKLILLTTKSDANADTYNKL